jgi:tRNA pseudouridine38-40 synthase
MSIKCDSAFTYEFRDDNVEFLTIYIKGQSFMLHQIRKMIGMTIAIIRGFCYKSDIQKSFEKYRMDVPRAPGLGLLLEQVHFDKYDKKYAKTHATLNDWGEEVEQKIQEIRKEIILPEILKAECETQSMMQWLTTLQNHTFLCDAEDEDGSSKSELCMATAMVKESTENAKCEAPLEDGLKTEASRETDGVKTEDDSESTKMSVSA